MGKKKTASVKKTVTRKVKAHKAAAAHAVHLNNAPLSIASCETLGDLLHYVKDNFKLDQPLAAAAKPMLEVFIDRMERK